MHHSDAERLAQLKMFDPFRPPNWRFERVLQLVDESSPRKRASHSDDYFVKTAKSFLQRWRTAEEGPQLDALLLENPGLFYALGMYDRQRQHSASIRTNMEARLLAGQTMEAVASAGGTLVEVPTWYERLFFNVIPRLEHRDWIVNQILIPSMLTSGFHDEDDTPWNKIHQWSGSYVHPVHDWTLKFFSYFGGPLMCEFMICGFRGNKLSNLDDLPDYLDDFWTTNMRRLSAQASRNVVIDRWNVMKLFETHQQIMQLARIAPTGDEDLSRVSRSMTQVLAGVPWCHGDSARDEFKETPLHQFDHIDAELTESELMQVSSGEVPSSLDDIRTLTITARGAGESNEVA